MLKIKWNNKNIEQKNELEKSTLRLTKDMIDNVKEIIRFNGYFIYSYGCWRR